MGFWELVHRPKQAPVAGGADPPHQPQSHLLQLPSEILNHIFSYLECPSLVSLSRTSKRLAIHAANDLLWANLLRKQLPPPDFPADPYPQDSYRSLYISHHLYWYLPRNKIWFSDEAHTGKIILVKFDPRRGCIEGYQIIAERGDPQFLSWSYAPNVIIHTFEPKPSLWLGNPVVRLEADPATTRTRQGWWDSEIKMRTGASGQDIFTTFFLSRAIPDRLVEKSMEVWPPLTIPGMPRVRNASQDNFQGWGHKPQKLEEISETTFRLRKYMQFSVGGSAFGVRVGDEVRTWSTLDPKLYTPTPDKPFQGIYVGDYAGHGCEFLLIMQTDKAPDPPRPNTESRFWRVRHANAMSPDTDEEQTTEAIQVQRDRSADDPTFKGSLEAIKLTGDPNVPRGEHTFIADDIGPGGFIRIAEEAPFKGARIVNSRGHVAENGFREDAFVQSQLIMISHDRLAQYWVDFGHISFYERVDIDQLLANCLWLGGAR